MRLIGWVVGYDQFIQVLNRPDGWKPAGTAGESIILDLQCTG